MSTNHLAASHNLVQATSAPFDEATRHAMIAEAAYFLSESRGFEPGWELEDWLNAEWDVDQRLAGHGFGTQALTDAA